MAARKHVHDSLKVLIYHHFILTQDQHGLLGCRHQLHLVNHSSIMVAAILLHRSKIGSMAQTSAKGWAANWPGLILNLKTNMSRKNLQRFCHFGLDIMDINMQGLSSYGVMEVKICTIIWMRRVCIKDYRPVCVQSF